MTAARRRSSTGAAASSARRTSSVAATPAASAAATATAATAPPAAVAVTPTAIQQEAAPSTPSYNSGFDASASSSSANGNSAYTNGASNGSSSSASSSYDYDLAIEESKREMKQQQREEEESAYASSLETAAGGAGPLPDRVAGLTAAEKLAQLQQVQQLSRKALQTGTSSSSYYAGAPKTVDIRMYDQLVAAHNRQSLKMAELEAYLVFQEEVINDCNDDLMAAFELLKQVSAA